MRETRSIRVDAAGLTLVELLVAVALLGAVGYFALSAFRGGEEARRALGARTDAESEARAAVLAATRLVNSHDADRADAGVSTASCATPAGPCLGVYRRASGGTSSLWRMTTACVDLSPDEAGALAGLGVDAATTAAAVAAQCGLTCGAGKRPVIVVQDPRGRETARFPPKPALGRGTAVAGGLCALRVGDEVQVHVGLAYPLPSGGLKLAEKHATIPVVSDDSGIHWLP